MFAFLETKRYICKKTREMEGKGFEISFMEEAEEFVMSLPEKARKKVTYNMLRVSRGEINNDLFKKLANTEIWEFRTLFEGMCYRLFAFWDTEACAPWWSQRTDSSRKHRRPPRKR